MAMNSLALSTNNISAQLAGKLDVAGGKVLQVVRATDSTDRSTTSATFVDASLSITITPQRNTSAILLIASYNADTTNAGIGIVVQITDSSNNAISGTGNGFLFAGTRVIAFQTLFAYATPATTSATTYKLRFRRGASSDTVTLVNSGNIAQLYAIEVSA